MQTFYRDLAEFGLPFVTPEQPEFSALAQEIRDRLPAFPARISGDLDGAAVMLNNSGKIVLSLSVLVRFSSDTRYTRKNHFTSLLSGRTLGLLSGDRGLRLDDNSLILPGSKRLISETGVWGNNYDVAPPPRGPTGGAAFGGSRLACPDAASRHIQVDLAIFEGGECAGPDEFGAFSILMSDLQTRRELAIEILSAIRKGVTREELYQRLSPIASRHTSPERGHHPNFILRNFATEVSRRLTDREDFALADWLEEQARPPRLELRRV